MTGTDLPMSAAGAYTAPLVTRRTLSDQVADGIVEMLVARGLRPDESIGSEQELAAQFGVSKLVVREAIRTLAARGSCGPAKASRRPSRYPAPTSSPSCWSSGCTSPSSASRTCSPPGG